MSLAEKQRTQREKVLNHLQEHGTITKAQAYRQHGVWNTGEVIRRLRKRGHEIETHQESPHDFATYELVEEAEE